MNIVIDINHPAHVHYFRNFSRIMMERGHKIYFIARNKEMEHRLLEQYGFKYFGRGKGSKGRLGKFIYLLYANFKILRISRSVKADVFLNFLHPYPSQVARLQGKVSLVFSDTEHASLHHRLTVPFASKIFTPACYRLNLGEKQVRFNGFMELAYLHPRYFKPDASVFDLLGIEPGTPYTIVRFVSWAAVHDFGHKGMSLENKRKAIQAIAAHSKVFITAEGPLPEDLEQYRVKLPVHRMHDALYYSSLLFGESATMASEAAVLGVPAIFIDNDGRGYTDEEERRYGIVFNFKETEADQERAIEKAVSILREPERREHYRSIRYQIVAECVDTTELMVQEVMKYEKKITAAAMSP